MDKRGPHSPADRQIPVSIRDIRIRHTDSMGTTKTVIQLSMKRPLMILLVSYCSVVAELSRDSTTGAMPTSAVSTLRLVPTRSTGHIIIGSTKTAAAIWIATAPRTIAIAQSTSIITLRTPAFSAIGILAGWKAPTFAICTLGPTTPR